MEMEVLKKRISSYKTPKGRLTRVPDELLVDILIAWEQWTGPANGFYSSLGVAQKKMASLLGKAKRLKREGFFPEEVFKEISVGSSEPSSAPGPCQGIEVLWENNKVIRFPQVEYLIDFLKKVS